MNRNTLLNLIALRGMREQSFKLAFGWKGGMKQCHTKGCEISVPLEYALKGIDISEALRIDRLYNHE